MNKSEPFPYINAENVKMLARMFGLRQEEPSVIAVVAGRLRPELARALLAALPAETRAGVEPEAGAERRLAQERVRSIDSDVRMNLDFVAGGDMRKIARELRPDVMGRALQGASPELVEKFFSNMSAGAVMLIREVMEYCRADRPPGNVEEARSQIIDVIKALDKEGMISVLPKGGDGMD